MGKTKNVTAELEKSLESQLHVLVSEVDEVDIRRDELIKCAESGEYTEHTSDHIRKCSAKMFEKIHKLYAAKRKREADVFLADLVISQFSSVLNWLGIVGSSEDLKDELGGNPILRKDIESVVSVVSPYIPLIGIIGGLTTTGKHIYKHKTQSKIERVSDE